MSLIMSWTWSPRRLVNFMEISVPKKNIRLYPKHWSPINACPLVIGETRSSDAVPQKDSFERVWWLWESGAYDLVVQSFLETLYYYFWMRVRASALGYYFRIFFKVKMNLCSDMHRWKYAVWALINIYSCVATAQS